MLWSGSARVTNTCATLKDKLGVAHTSGLIRIALGLE
jgi:hypothetical protein